MSTADSTRSEPQPIVIHGPVTGGNEPLVAGNGTHTATMLPPDEANTTIILDAPVPAAAPVERPAATPVPTTAERAAGLDALRGLLLVAMNFTFTMPMGVFPAWAYHAQYPPPDGAFAPIAGLTWQDTIYAGFMFVMSAALPISMAARLARRITYPEIILTSLRRCFALYVFALIIGHVNPYWTQLYDRTGNVLSIAGFFLLFALFLQPRKDWSPVRMQWLRIAGVLGVLALFFLVPPAIYGSAFSPNRRDDIIASIAWTSVAVTVIWLCTRTNVAARLAVLGVIIALRTGARHADWLSAIWNWTPAPWLYDTWFIEMLLVAIPGSIAGDLIAQWMRANGPEETRIRWSNGRLALLSALAFSVLPVLLVGLWERRAVGTTTAAIFAIGGLMLWFTRRPESTYERVLSRLFGWGAFWLILGMLTEPLEDGIRKVPLTLSYLTLMTGLSYVFLGALVICADHFKALGRRLRPLVAIGQNSLLAYVILNLFLMHLLWVTGVAQRLQGSWQEALLRSVVITAAGTLLVWLATRKRVFWRA